VSSATVIRHNPLQDYINMPFERFYPDESDDDIQEFSNTNHKRNANALDQKKKMGLAHQNRGKA
jgi:hypothetical protein